MSKEVWVQHYNRLRAQLPHYPPDLLAVLADEAVRDELAEQADWARTLEKENRK